MSITNQSALPQSFAFLDPPEGVAIRPCDGFGNVLPGDTMEVRRRNIDTLLKAKCLLRIRAFFVKACRFVQRLVQRVAVQHAGDSYEPQLRPCAFPRPRVYGGYQFLPNINEPNGPPWSRSRQA